MARTKQTPAPTPKAPDFIAWIVRSKGDKTFWQRIGASWFHHDGNGLSLQLDTLPLDGRVVLRAPLEQTQEGGRA